MFREDGYYRKSSPREAKGGIKAQSGRGAFGKSWWAKRWIEVLEGFDIGARLARGRSYARRGQVLSVEIEKGIVTARVQGSRARPYKVEIKVKTLTEEEWARLIEALSSQALFVSKLLAGEMPQEIETAFDQAGLSLFPQKSGDLSTDCSCPDWSNPCKHIAAVYYLLGEEFDRDPFLIFKLRGMSREEMIERLHGSEVTTSAPEALPPQPLPPEAAAFWHGQDMPEDIAGDIRPPSITAALPKRLGPFPLWQGEQPLLQAIEPAYSGASAAALDLFMR